METGLTFDDFRKNNRYDIACFYDIGKRESQQDSAYIAADDLSVFAVVCDGMGGYEGGQLASKTAIEAYTEYYEHFGTGKDNLWMQRAVRDIDEIVYRLADDTGRRLGAGTTLVSIRIDGNDLSWMSVGDSRIYIIRGSEMSALTSDHNYFFDLNRKRQSGLISEEEYRKESVNGEALISFLGMGGLTLMDTNETPLTLISGDIILICTDGLYRSVSDADLLKAARETDKADSFSAELRKLIDKRNNPGQDNYTYIIIRIS